MPNKPPPQYSLEAQDFAAALKSLNPKNITELDLEKLLYLRKKFYTLDGQLYIRVKNHLEEVPTSNLETIVLSVLDDMFQLIGKRGKIKAVADLVKLRTPDHFTEINPSHKQIAFTNAIFNAETWQFSTTYNDDAANEIFVRTDCTYQLNFDYDSRLTYTAFYYNPGYVLETPNYPSPNLPLNFYQLPKLKSDLFKDAIALYNKSLQTVTQQPDGSFLYSNETYVYNSLLYILFNTPTPTADKFFTSIANGNNDIIERIYQMIGYILVPGNEAKAYFLLQGVPNTGKTVLGNFLEGYFPRELISSLDIGRIGGQFLPESLTSCCLNLSMDLPQGKMSANSAAVIKMLTGNDLVTQEVKFKDAKPYRGRCKLVFATNFDLKMDEYDPAFLNRTICIPFTKSVPKDEQNTELLKELEKERPAITAKALASYYFLRANNFKFAGDGIIMPNVKYTMDHNEIIELFAKEMCIFTDDERDRVSTQQLHASYLEFCRVRGLPQIVQIKAFSQRFAARFPLIIKSINYTSNLNGYSKIKLLDTPVAFDINK